MRKTTVYIMMIFVLCGLLIVNGLGAPACAETLKIRLSTEPSKPDMAALLADKFAEIVNAKLGDKAQVKLFLGGVLGSQKALQEQVKLGTIESIVTASDIVELDVKFGIFDFPFLFSGRDHVYRLLDGELGKALNKHLIETQGVRVLAFGELGFRQITNNVRPISTPEDLKGLRLRVPPTKMRLEAFKALGASPTPIAWAELYQALSQGVVDGQENPISAILGASFYEVQKFLSISNHVYTPAYILVSEKWWQGLPSDIRAGLSDAANASVEWQRSFGSEEEGKLLGELKDKGMKVNQIDHASFATKAKTVWAAFSEKVGAEIVDMVMQAQ
jgi:tripartite ATP-independent transporter DctP family solute receptor